ncbi:MAG TPA: TonB family protein [Spirochaetota bacterium]|nr:TonB family protein [Spirochaetota bacterium]
MVTSGVDMTSGGGSKQGAGRFMLSIMFALLFHGLLFIVLQWVYPLKPEEELEYTGPIYVTIEEFEPVVVKKAPEITEISSPPAVEETVKLPKPQPTIPQVERPKSPTLVPSVPRETAPKAVVPRALEPAEDEVLTEGIRRVIIPADEKLPAGLEVPTLTENQKPASVPPEFLTKEDTEKPSQFNLSRLDDALVTDSDKTPQTSAEGSAASTVPTEGVAVSKGGPVITWEEEGEERSLLSPIKNPEIPSWVNKEGLNLDIVVSFAVTPEGHTSSIKVERSTGYPDVDASVLDTVRKLKFNPVSGDRTVRGRINYMIRTK